MVADGLHPFCDREVPVQPGTAVEHVGGDHLQGRRDGYRAPDTGAAAEGIRPHGSQSLAEHDAVDEGAPGECIIAYLRQG